jgi:hypothetical protein
MSANKLWQDEAMRMGGQPLIQLLSEVRDNQLDMMANFDSLSKKVADGQAATDRLLSGFPAEDLDGHRRYHESVIEWRELRNKLVRDLLMKAAQATFMGALGFLALAAWKAFQISVTR